MKRIKPTALLGAVLSACIAGLPTSAPAEEPINVFFASRHDLDYTKRVCERIVRTVTTQERSDQQSGSTNDDAAKQASDAAAQCRSVKDYRELARKVENELLGALAANSKCSRIALRRDPDDDYDRSERKDDIRKLRERLPTSWELDIDYDPREVKYHWYLFPYAGGNPSGPSLNGEGDTKRNAEQICSVLITRTDAATR